MIDKVFLDSNVILYSYSKTELNKNKIANTLIFSLSEVYISTQVINEVTNILYSEDMQHNLIIENQLKIINPFIYNATKTKNRSYWISSHHK